jgi:hypothetical protein
VSGDAGAAVLLALADFAAAGVDGGEIVFLPGTYTFPTTVVLPTSARGLRLSGSRGALLVPLGSGPMFEVLADDVCLAGLAFEDLSPASGRSLVAVRGDGVSIEDCTFRVIGPQSTPLSAYRAVVVEDTIGGDGRFRRARVSGSTFAFGNPVLPGLGQQDAIAVLAREGSDVSLVGNTFRAELFFTPCGGGGPPCSAWIEYAVLLEGVDGAVLSANTFLQLGFVDSRLEAAIGVRDGSRTVVVGNYFETVVARNCAIDVLRSPFTVIEANGIGRSSGGIHVAGDLSPGPDRAEVVITGNELHNIGLGGEGASYGILVEDLEDVSITANKHGLCRVTQMLVLDCRRTHVVGNQFFAQQGSIVGQAAVHLDGGDAHFFANNTAHETSGGPSWTAALFVENVVPGTLRQMFNDVLMPP